MLGPSPLRRHPTPGQLRSWGKMSDTRELVKLLGTKFIQRKDVKAFQREDGAWFPDRTKFTMQDFADHLEGRKTLGHYMLDQDGYCKLFAFDLDLVKHARNCTETTCKGCAVTFANLVPDDNGNPQAQDEPLVGIPREMYYAGSPALDTLTINLRCLAEGLALKIDKIGVPVAVATSGHKGLHVYGFTGSIPAEAARQLALNVLEELSVFEPFRGQNFWRHKFAYEVLDIEVFPKQGSLEGKDLGNLMKLPLGVHRVTGQRAEFISMKSGYSRLVSMDPTRALDGDLPWE